MRIDVVGRHHGADQGIGEDVREGEAVRAFLASASGERIHRFLSCRTAISTLLAHVDQIHPRAGVVLALGHGVLGRMTGDGYVSSRERPAAFGKHPPG